MDSLSGFGVVLALTAMQVALLERRGQRAKASALTTVAVTAVGLFVVASLLGVADSTGPLLFLPAVVLFGVWFVTYRYVRRRENE